MTKQKKEPVFEVKDNERIQVEEEMLNLKNSAGWQRVEKYYDSKIKWLENELAEGEITDMEQFKLMRMKRNGAVQFRNLPEIIIAMVQKGHGQPIDLDPYDKPLTTEE